MSKNKLGNLNDHLFAELERLSAGDVDFRLKEGVPWRKLKLSAKSLI